MTMNVPACVDGMQEMLQRIGIGLTDDQQAAIAGYLAVCFVKAERDAHNNAVNIAAKAMNPALRSMISRGDAHDQIRKLKR